MLQNSVEAFALRAVTSAWRARRGVAVLAGSLAMVLSGSASAESISRALARAYLSNPDINQQRANVRSVDENIPRATSGYYPKVNATGNVGYEYLYSRAGVTNPAVRPSGIKYDSVPRGYGVNVSQTVFDGFRTYNGVRQAESQTLGARESLRTTEQNILLQGATFYMNVLRDSAIVNLRASNIKVLEEQLRQTRDRFQVGEVTRTDVAQAEASLATSRSDYAAAQAALQGSIASFRQTIGIEPKKLEPASSVERLLPKRLGEAVEVSQVEHPVIAAALHQVDVVALGVKVAEGALYPTATINGSVNRSIDSLGQTGAKSFAGIVSGQLNVPIYQGGAEYASIRQAKEQLSQARLQADLQRDGIRANVVTTWGQLETAKAQLISGQAAVTAAEIALNGIREEAKVGQRTTFDVLNAQQVLLNTRVSLVTAQRDRVVFSYSVLSAMGRLSIGTLGLDVASYDPTVHFDQVKNKRFGVHTPDGK